MTATTWAPGLCPHCLHDAFAPLSDGRRLCLNPDCRWEYGPDETPTEAMVRTGDAPKPLHAVPDLPMSTADDLAPRLVAARGMYVGNSVTVFDLEQVGTVTGIGDDGIAEIEFGSGFRVYCYPDEFSLVESDEPPDEVISAIASTDLAVVSQILRAGIETIDVQGDAMKMGMAPDGWLPMEADIMPVIEHGAAYAIAWLAVTFNVSKQQLEDAAQAFANAATAAREATTT